MSSVLPISLSNIQSEFGGTDPIFMSEYYDGGAFVTGGDGIPVNGRLSLSNFRGKSKISALMSLISNSKIAVAAYGFKLYNSTYTGPVVNVRRSTDSATSDFYASITGKIGTTLGGNGTQLSTWLTGATGYITSWYDQTGRNKHLTQATTSVQPVISSNANGLYAYFTTTVLAGDNVFDTSTVNNMHIVFASQELSRTANVLISLHGTNTIGTNRFLMHTPYLDGVWYFDPGNAVNDRVASSANITAIGQRNVFSGYKSSANGNNAFRVNTGTRYTSSANSSGNVTGGIRFGSNVSANTNQYLYGCTIFNAKLSSADEIIVEAAI